MWDYAHYAMPSVETGSLHPQSVKDQVIHAEMCGDEKAPIDYSGARAKTTDAEVRLVRKLDYIMLPVLWLMYWFNYLDRNAITVARLDHLEKDLGITSTQYQTCVSILFVGYVLGQVPASECVTHVQALLIH
jgi:hypothetical protein